MSGCAARRHSTTEQELDLEQRLVVARAKQGLLNFTRFTKPDYEINWHHRIVARYLNKVASGEITRLMLNLGPRHGKSELVSRRFPAYYLGRNPDHQVMAASYNATLAARMNRDVQRIIDAPSFNALFPDTTLSASNIRTVARGKNNYLRNSDEFEVVGRRGIYRSAGVGGSATGYGAHLAIIDDPVRNREDANSQTYRDKTFDWYTSTLYSRLEKGGSIVLCMCMTGDTPVLMADGRERPLSALRVGDRIATYDDGKLGAEKVVNWASQGLDYVYRLKTIFGITVKANRRHPFLVCREGELLWVRLGDLRQTDRVMRVAAPTRASSVRSMAATGQPSARQCACSITASLDGQPGTAPGQPTQLSDGAISLNIATASATQPTTHSCCSKQASAQSASGHLCLASTCLFTGKGDFASTTAINPGRLEDCSAIAATTSFGTPTPKRCCGQQSFICEPIAEIKGVGYEEVFDIQVARTENFIANGLATHNTRWHEDDLAGRLLAKAKEDPEVDQWVVVSFPTICEDTEHPYDPRQIGEPLWPNKYSQKRLTAMRKTMGERDWVSLHQQRPAPAEGNVIKDTWWRYWKELPEEIDLMICSADLTFKKGAQNDFSVLLTMARSGPNIYIVDMIRSRMGWTEQKRALGRVLNQYPDLDAIYIEEAANGAALVEEARATVPRVVAVPAKGSKYTRLEAVSAMIEAGNVLLPHPSTGLLIAEQIVNEVNAFPYAKNDDIVDALSMGLRRARSEFVDYNFSVGTVPKQSFSAALRSMR